MKIAVESAGKVMCMLSKRDKDGGIQGDAPGNPFRAVDLEGAVASEDIKMQVSEAPDAIAREEVDVVSVDAGSDDASNAPSGGSGTSTGLFDDLVGSAFRGAHEDVAGSSVRTGDIKAESSIGDGPTGSAKTADGPTGSGDDAPDDALTAFGLADGQDNGSVPSGDGHASDGDGGDDGSFLDSGEPDDGEDTGDHRRWWLWVVIGVVIALLVAGVGLGGYYMMNPPSQKIDNSSKVGGNAIGGKSSSTGGDVGTAAQEKKFLDDAGVPDFYQVPRDEQSDDQKAEALEYALVTEPTNAVGRFMSKDSNPDLTDDPSKYLLEDGSTNPNYSYLTGENTTGVIRDDIERLVNPVYGGWTFLQDPNRLDYEKQPGLISDVSLYDMFDPAVSNGVSKDEAGLRGLTKLYADWDRNQYGGEWSGKQMTDPIIGKVVNYDCDYNVTGSMNDTIACTAQVNYTGKINSVDGESSKKSIDRTLKLNYKVNYDTDTDRRILLTSVEQ